MEKVSILNYLTGLKKIEFYIYIPFWVVLFVLGHYYLSQIPAEIYHRVRVMTVTALTTFCLAGAIFLFVKSEGIRVRNAFGLQLLLVGLAGLASVVGSFFTGQVQIMKYEFVSPSLLLYGSLYASVFLLFPMEALRPGWVNWKNGFLLVAPVIAFYFIYKGVTEILPPVTYEIRSVGDMFYNFGDFNIWFRCLVLSYPVFTWMQITRYKKRYERWCEDNLAATEQQDLDWINYYIFGYFIVICSYLYVILANNRQTALMHNVVFFVFLSYVFYKVTTLKSPYPEGYKEQQLEQEEAEALADSLLDSATSIQRANGDDESERATHYLARIPEYKSLLNEWMEREKPYHKKDFKLSDITVILPLNRSYLSRLFKEGYNESFYQYVMRYRLEDSIKLLKNRSDLNISNIADICGFSSASVFGRAFLKEMGQTPLQYRKQYAGSEEDAKRV